MHQHSVLGIGVIVACVVAFGLVLPRGGRSSLLLRSDMAESTFMMVWLLVLISGAALALFGVPTGVTVDAPKP